MFVFRPCSSSSPVWFRSPGFGFVPCSHFTCGLIGGVSVKNFRIRICLHSLLCRRSPGIGSRRRCWGSAGLIDCPDSGRWPCSSSPGVRFVPCSHFTCVLIEVDSVKFYV